jgi:hypothetical protein
MVRHRHLATTVCALCLALSSVSCTEDSVASPPWMRATETPSGLRTDSSSQSTVDAGQPDGRAPADAASVPIPRVRTSLIDHTDWRVLDPHEDPFVDRPSQSVCGPEGVSVTALAGELSYDIETGTCNYITAVQSTQRAVTAGELLKLRVWHFELTAPAPAEAHVVVMVDGVFLLDTRVAIPAPGGLIKSELRIDRPIAAGAPIYFHLHNHGQNSWALVEVSAGP